jgi:LysR family glycine cleavage system transcriptional activator
MDALRAAREYVEQARRSNHLVVSALPSLATKWLGPLFFEWMKSHPDASVRLEARDAEPQLEAGEADFRVSYGARSRQHRRFAHLYTDYVTVVASPALLAKQPAKHPRDLLKRPLLWVDWLSEYIAAPNWPDWFTSLDIPCEGLRCDLSFSAPSAAIDGAIEGRGFALVQHSTAASTLASGALVRVFPHVLKLPESHFLAWNAGALDKPLGSAVQAWLLLEARRLEYRESK